MPQLDYPEDCLRIQTALLNHGYTVTLAEAQELWRQWSESLCAGWLNLDGADDSYILTCVQPFIQETVQ